MAEMVLGFGPRILHDPFLWFHLNSYLFLPLALDFAKEEVTKKFMFVLKFPNNHWVKEGVGDDGSGHLLFQLDELQHVFRCDSVEFPQQDGAEDFKLWLPEDESFAQVTRLSACRRG